MISALILPLFLAGTQANIGGAPSADPPIRLWISNDGRFLPGDHAEVQVWTKDDGYLLVLHADPNGQLRVLFPLDPDDDNFVRGGEWYDVKGRGGREAFDIDSTSGRGMVYAAVSRDRFRFDGYRLGNQWDYQALAPSQLPLEPESELTDLVRRMAQGDFDYDVLTYDVTARVVYASDYSAPTNFGRVRPFSRSRFVVSAHFFFGRPFRRLHPPFRFGFDPFFDPFLFDPFFHPGFFVDPFFRRPFLHQPALVDRFFHRRFFLSPRDLGPAPFRDRRSDFRGAVNTADLTRWRGARGAATASQRGRVEFRSEGPARLAAADARQPGSEARHAWPVDVSPRRREPITEARRDNWPVDVSPRRREPVTEARRDNWPVDVSPRRPNPDPPTGRRAEADRPAEVRPQIDRAPLREARRASRIEGRPGLEMAPPARGSRESSSPPRDRGSDRRSWSPPSDRDGFRGFAPSAPPSDGGGRGVSRRR